MSITAFGLKSANRSRWSIAAHWASSTQTQNLLVDSTPEASTNIHNTIKTL